MNALTRLPARRRVYLLRHAQVSYFDAEGRPLDPRQVPLTPRGREQADAAGTLLAEVRFDLALCSGLPRTEETARRILGDTDTPLHSEPRLQEIRAGRLREVPAEQREQAIAYAYDGAELPEARFIGGERWGDFAQRVGEAWDQLLARSDWHDLLLVAHDAVNRVILSRLCGSGLAGLKAFEQDPACINIIEVDPPSHPAPRGLIRCLNLAAYDLIRPDQRLTVMEQVWRSFNPQARP
ncbi:histidine phosphatase family protein [Pseudomonas sp. MOB-449]|nr:histidine phosphatase family protein [Pseudomonas sp. MOB-449]